MGEVLQGYVSLGSNLGHRLGHLQAAASRLAQTPGLMLRRLSSVYESPAWGFDSPFPFYNAVVEVVWANEPLMLVEILQAIETVGGRQRSQPGPAGVHDPLPRYTDRPIDLDVLWLAGVESAEPRLLLPHPRALQRAFVLVPWAELAPGLEVRGAPLLEWLAGLPLSEVEATRRVLDPDWLPAAG